MRIAFLAFDFGEYCVRLASSISRNAEIMLVLPAQELEPHLALLAPSVCRQPFWKPRLRHVFAQARTIKAIHSYIAKFAPDIVHIQLGHPWFNLTLAFLARYALVLTVHDAQQHLGAACDYKYPQGIIDLGAHRADEVIVHAPQIKERLVKRLRIAAEHVHVIPHVMIGDDMVQPHCVEEEHTILFFGRIWPYKGLEYLIRAEPLITGEFPNVKIIIAGEGEDFKRYLRMMAHPDRFIVHNSFISNERRAELFRQASVIVLPYVEASQSGVIPIAYAHEKPVVATTVGGLPDMVENGRTGLLVPPRNEHLLADAVKCLLRDKSMRREFGVRGKRKLETECSPDVVAQMTLRVYEQALRDGR